MIDTIIDFLHKQKFKETSQVNISNISKEEQFNGNKWFNGFNEIKNIYIYIILKETNKGGIGVIMGTKHYCKMVYDHLNDKQIYKKIDKICKNKEINKIARSPRTTIVCFLCTNR